MKKIGTNLKADWKFGGVGLLWIADLVFLAVMGHPGRHLVLFSMLYVSAFGLMLLMVRCFPKGLRFGRAVLIIWIVAIAGRAVFVFYPPGNDMFRYIWEGVIQNSGVNPYLAPPDSPSLTKFVQGDLRVIWAGINHKQFAAIYPPVPLLLFRLLAAVKPAPIWFKLLLITFDLGVLFCLILWIRLLDIAPARLLLYAANPLVILYIAGEGHLDVLQIFFLCVGIYLILRNRPALGFLFLGLAVLSKYMALVAVPFLLTHKYRRVALIIFCPLILYLPFAIAGKQLFASLEAFSTSMHYNDSVTAVFRWLFGQSILPAALAFLAVCLAWIYLTDHDPLHSVYLALGVALLCLPTLHPWYLLILAPFMVLYASQAWLFLMAAVVFTFPVVATDYATGVFHENTWLKWAEYTPFYVLLIRALFCDGLLFRNRRFDPPRSVSVVVPTLNEADTIERCLTHLQNRTGLREILVADGGSTDGTIETAARCGVRVVHAPMGRGLQIKEAVRHATGDVVVILHADCIAEKGVFSDILESLASHAYAVGGAVSMRFELKGLKTRILAGLNNLRARLTGISFGDQTQFFRTAAVDKIGGFPAMMLMEDVELSLRLKPHGRLLFLNGNVTVSGRRWQGRGFYKNLRTVLRLFPGFLIKRRWGLTDSIQEDYYKIYYSSVHDRIST
jgi:rSAM/selenodomain-associated transferase 2